LVIVGGGSLEEESSVRELAKRLGVSERIQWKGRVSHGEVQSEMKKSGFLLFTSVSEGTPHVILESIANGLPIVCFDTCGQGDVVDHRCGVKVTLSNPQKSVQEFSKICSALLEDQCALKVLQDGCGRVAKENSWENRIKSMLLVYEAAIANHEAELRK